MANASKTKNQKPSWFRRVGAKIKETFSEVKRVSWPSFLTVLKTTGVVLVVVAAFLAIITGVDALLGLLFDSLVGLS
jgi:preprotein translocase SecE subunit